MKLITPYLLRFAGFVALLTLVFRYFLSFGIDTNSVTLIVGSSVLYSIAMFLCGWYWGRKDGEHLRFFDVDFVFI